MVRRVPGFRDKESTRQRAAELERQAAREATGLLDKYAEPRSKPIAEHIEDYRTYLRSKGNTAKHVKLAIGRVGRCLRGCGFRFLTDLDANRVMEWLAEQR